MRNHFRNTLLVLTAILLFVLGGVSADSSGPNSPGTGANDAAVGTKSWSATDAIFTSNDAKAQTQTLLNGHISNYLFASNFGFAIPDGATIEGILVEIERVRVNNTATVKDHRVRIVKGGTIGSTDKADTATNWPTADAYASYGGASDLWGETWSASNINASDFGVALAVICTDPNEDENTVARVDHMRITVTYSGGTPSGKRKRPAVISQTRSSRSAPYRAGEIHSLLPTYHVTF